MRSILKAVNVVGMKMNSEKSVFNRKEMEMKSILIGSVDSSKVVLEEMIKLNFLVDPVFSRARGDYLILCAYQTNLT